RMTTSKELDSQRGSIVFRISCLPPPCFSPHPPLDDDPGVDMTSANRTWRRLSQTPFVGRTCVGPRVPCFTPLVTIGNAFVPSPRAERTSKLSEDGAYLGMTRGRRALGSQGRVDDLPHTGGRERVRGPLISEWRGGYGSARSRPKSGETRRPRHRPALRD